MVRRRTEYNLKKQETVHILEGLRIALDHMMKLSQQFVNRTLIKLRWQVYKSVLN